jgi:hypothetical protein
MDAPKPALSITESEEPNLDTPKRATDEPNRDMLRIDMEAPMQKKSKTANDEPRRDSP